MRKLAAFLYLGGQVALCIGAQFGPSRHFCWAPYSSVNKFHIVAKVDGRELSIREMSLRYYGVPSYLSTPSVEPRSMQHVKDIIVQYEETLGANKPAEVSLRYSVNGKPWESWQWPSR